MFCRLFAAELFYSPPCVSSVVVNAGSSFENHRRVHLAVFVSCTTTTVRRDRTQHTDVIEANLNPIHIILILALKGLFVIREEKNCGQIKIHLL